MDVGHWEILANLGPLLDHSANPTIASHILDHLPMAVAVEAHILSDSEEWHATVKKIAKLDLGSASFCERPDMRLALSSQHMGNIMSQQCTKQLVRDSKSARR